MKVSSHVTFIELKGRGNLTGTPPSLYPIFASSTAMANASWSFILGIANKKYMLYRDQIYKDELSFFLREVVELMVDYLYK